MGYSPAQSGLVDTYVTIMDLLAHANYTFEVEAVNGVSDLSRTQRLFAAVSIATGQAGKRFLSNSMLMLVKFLCVSKGAVKRVQLTNQQPEGSTNELRKVKFTAYSFQLKRDASVYSNAVSRQRVCFIASVFIKRW